MHCLTFCTASKYDLEAFSSSLPPDLEIEKIADVLHLRVHDKGEFVGDAFFFEYGVMVLWAVPKKHVTKLLKEIAPFEQGSLRPYVHDEFLFSYGERSGIQKDEIVLETQNVLAKVAASYGISQSAKLEAFEGLIEKTIQNTRYLPEKLAHQGKIKLSRKAISRKMGSLFIERSSVNLHTDILDIPDFFWDYTEEEPLYVRMRRYLHLDRRVDILNRRLEIVHDLFEMLGSELNHQHSARLELTIVYLIVIEVVLVLLKDVFHLL